MAAGVASTVGWLLCRAARRRRRGRGWVLRQKPWELRPIARGAPGCKAGFTVECADGVPSLNVGKRRAIHPMLWLTARMGKHQMTVTSQNSGGARLLAPRSELLDPSAAWLGRVQPAHSEEWYSTGATIEHVAEEQPVLRIVQSGWAGCCRSLPDGRRQILHLLLPGDICGLASFSSQPSGCSTVALSRVGTANFGSIAAVLRAETVEHRAMADLLRSQAVRQHQALVDHLVRLGRLSALERTALAARPPRPPPGGGPRRRGDGAVPAHPGNIGGHPRSLDRPHEPHPAAAAAGRLDPLPRGSSGAGGQTRTRADRRLRRRLARGPIERRDAPRRLRAGLIERPSGYRGSPGLQSFLRGSKLLGSGTFCPRPDPLHLMHRLFRGRCLLLNEADPTKPRRSVGVARQCRERDWIASRM